MTHGLLEGTVALVVGGATGIGRGVVDRFLEEGARLTVLDLDDGPLAGVAAARPDRLAVVPGDATDPACHEAAVARTVEQYDRLDTLVCCAGRFDFRTPIGALAPDQLSRAFDELFAVNVKSAVLAVRASMGALRRQRGSVVLTLSGSAFYPEGSGVLYGTSKWAARGLVAHLARELAPEVRVNGVAPGGTAGTRLTAVDALLGAGPATATPPEGAGRPTVERDPERTRRLAAGSLLERAATPADHAGSYVFLASARLSPLVTGAVVNSDGGRGEPIGRAGVRGEEGARVGHP